MLGVGDMHGPHLVVRVDEVMVPREHQQVEEARCLSFNSGDQ